MISNEIRESLRSIYQNMPKESLSEKGDGWVNLANLGTAIRKAGIDYKALGFDKLGDIITQSGIFSVCTDFTKTIPVKYLREKVRTPRSQQQQLRRVMSVDLNEVTKVKTRLRLESNFFIGQFVPALNDGWYKISDIRNTDFTKVEDKERGVKNLSISFKSQNLQFNRYAYYKFTWVLLESSPLKFGIDLREEVIPVYPRDIVRSLHDGIMRYPAGAAKKISRSLDTLKRQLTQSGKEVFIYELLQNANDYPRRQKVGTESVSLPVEVEFHVTKQYLTFQHTGEYFNAKNIAAICDINDGEKSGNVEAIGYKGIGFKTVFLDNDYVFLNTGDYSFRFDKSATDVINTPWQILPIWTELFTVGDDVKNVFGQHPNDEFRVKFALQPRDNKILTDERRDDNYVDLFSNIFDSERVILFIPNIKKVSIYFDDTTIPSIIREKDSSDWCVSDSLVDDIPEEIREKINDVLNNPDSLRSDGYEKIPEKYLNFYKTAVKFACKKEGRKLLPVEDSVLYCYLPAKRADWGFKFLMNTDMVPNGQRDDIEDIELNHIIARIAGKRFFWWIKSLIISGEFDLDPIFALIPDFDECKKKRVYQTFLDEFQKEFETLILEEPFVPVVDKDGETSYKCINNIINDMTGITANAVIPDSDFISMMELEGNFLPIRELRTSGAFMDFLYIHSPSELDIKIDTVVKKCENEDFQEWLGNDDNNCRFIKHLLKKDELDEFVNKTIFIEYKGELFAAKKLYYDFEKNCDGIDFLRYYVPHLCQQTREAFAEEEAWATFVSKYFINFDAVEMIRTYIIDCEEAMALLEKPENSVLFYKYLATNEIDLEDSNGKVPYVTEDNESVTDYNNYRYFFSEQAFELINENWLGDNTIRILSHIYFDGETDEKMKSIFERVGFVDFEKIAFVSNVIAINSDFRVAVNVVIEADFDANNAFVGYVYGCNAELKNKSLLFKDYMLRCEDINGEEVCLCNDDLRYFNQASYANNSTFEDNLSHDWLADDMMYALSSAYFDSYEVEEAKKLDTFFRQQFGIKTFTDKSFFSDVVLKNKKVIYESLTDETSMMPFLAYLMRDAERIFDDTMSFNDIKDMPLLCHDGIVIVARTPNVRLVEYDEDAIALYNKKWCPQVFTVLSKDYTHGFTGDFRLLFKIGQFDLSAIATEILSSANFVQSVNVLTYNIDFWRWVEQNQKSIASFEVFKRIALLDANNVPASCDILYISDAYQQDGIESLVAEYVPTAQFVSSVYVQSDSDIKRSEWLKLFKRLGLKSDNKDILFKDVLPNLVTFERNSVVAMMTRHLKDLKAVWSEKKHQIIQLRVRTRSDEYKRLDQVVIVSISEESVTEPFKYIALSDEVHPDILKSNTELLLLISAEFNNCNLIENKQDWVEAKVRDYVRRHITNEQNVAAIHINFVRELVKLQEEYTMPTDLKKQIKYRTKGGNPTYLFAHELTLSSVYSPICDFEANGVEDLHYISDEYIFEGNRDIIKSYFKGEGLHQNMLREDLQFLAIRSFACYFWSYSFSKRITEYETWMEEGLFINKVCIPTEDSVKVVKDLYAPWMATYAAKSPNWKEKMACKSVVDKIESRDARELFNKLLFNLTLSFEDCLYYLLNAQDRREDERSRREMVVNWILAADEPDEELVKRYRNTSTALWRNGKGQKKHITELYAIHPSATQERAIFSGDESVMQTSMFPYSSEDFERVCKILQITCLSSLDFVATPIGKNDETAGMMAIIRPRLLILAAIENSDKFPLLYERYNEKLAQYRFVVCEKIDLGYDTIHNDVERIYNDESHIYYVSSWQHNRTFTKFCSKLKKLLEFEVYDNVCEDVLDINNSIETCIEKYCSALAYSEKFRSYLQNLNLTIKTALEDEPQPSCEDYYSNTLADSEDACVSLQKGTTTNKDDTYLQIDDNEDYEEVVGEDIEVETEKEDAITTSVMNPQATSHQILAVPVASQQSTYDPDNRDYIGSVEKDKDYQPLGDRPWKPRTRRHPKPFTGEEVNRLRSNGTPLELESLPPTREEINILTQCNIRPEQIADTNYLAQLRLYLNLTRVQHEQPLETMEQFVRNAGDVTTHELEGGRYIHSCSAARGVMYISPSVWNKMVDDKWKICVYLDGQGNNFHYINNVEEFLRLVDKDDVVIKITGKEKKRVVNDLYTGILNRVKGTAYTLIRVAARTNMDAVFAHYVGAMAEEEDGNEDINDYF